MDHRTTLAYAIALVLGLVSLVALTLWVRAKLTRAGARRRARKRSRRAIAGEVRAETLLESLGYDIESRQEPCVWTIYVDGEAHEVSLRADLLVSRDGRSYIAEVKTGAKAPKLTTAATRRQLLEYRLAYPDIAGVLLVDAESNRVMDVEFPRVDDIGRRGGNGRSNVGRVGLVLLVAWLAGVATGAML